MSSTGSSVSTTWTSRLPRGASFPGVHREDHGVIDADVRSALEEGLRWPATSALPYPTARFGGYTAGAR